MFAFSASSVSIACGFHGGQNKASLLPKAETGSTGVLQRLFFAPILQRAGKTTLIGLLSSVERTATTCGTPGRRRAGPRSVTQNVRMGVAGCANQQPRS